MFSSGCAKSSTGKVDLSSRTVPGFLRSGTTTIEDVLKNIGEPFGYREQGNRSAMIYLSYQEEYFSLLFTQIRMQESHRLELEFNKNILQKEIEIIKEELKNSGKNSEMIEKIANGKIKKFVSDNTLLNQIWILDSKKKVSQIIKEFSENDEIKIIDFVRFKVGEGID